MPLKDAALGAAAGASASWATALFLLQRYLQRELKTPELVHWCIQDGRIQFGDKDLADQHLLQEVKLLLREYWPHPILEFSGYTSTIWSGFWGALPCYVSPGNVEILTLQDGGTVSLHWIESSAVNSKAPITLVLPGLNNDSRTSFVQETMRHLQAGGFRAAALNFRGTGGLSLTSPRLGCADSWQDLPEVLEHIRKANPGVQLFAMGFSMGGGMLLRYLGEAGGKTPLQAAVAIAAPVDFPAVGASLESTFKKRVMNMFMVNGVKLFGMRSLFSSQYAASIDKVAVLKARTLRQLEDLTVCKLHGYRDAWDYYASNSPRDKLAGIAVPVLVVNAADDPVVSVNTMPVEDMRRNPSIYLSITRRGGHIGWGSGGMGAACWTDNMAVAFMQACTLRSRL